MATRKPPLQPQPARLTADDMRAAIPKLKRRIEELSSFNPLSVTDDSDPLPDSLVRKIDDTLISILGADSLDYQRSQIHSLDWAQSYGERSISELRQSYSQGKAEALSRLQTLIEIFDEKLADSGETKTGRALRGFADLDLHSEVKRAAADLFLDGHYANAVEDACKVLDLLVRMRSGDDRSGTELMLAVFSPNAPILKFNNSSSETDRSEQQGMMFLYAGVMLAFRNPRAHDLVNDDAEKALEIISFISFLAKSLDRAKR